MAILEIEIAAEEQARLDQQARQAGLSVNDWARRQLFGTLPVRFTTDDGEVYEIPDLPADLSGATAKASESVLAKFWDRPEEDAAWLKWGLSCSESSLEGGPCEQSEQGGRSPP